MEGGVSLPNCDGPRFDVSTLEQTAEQTRCSLLVFEPGTSWIAAGGRARPVHSVSLVRGWACAPSPFLLRLQHHYPMPDKPMSEEIRRESEKLLEMAAKLREQASSLIESAALEKKIRGRDGSKLSKRA